MLYHSCHALILYSKASSAYSFKARLVKICMSSIFQAKSICEKVFAVHPEFEESSKSPSFELFSDSNFCGKMKVLDKLLKLFKQQKDKVLLFSYSTQVSIHACQGLFVKYNHAIYIPRLFVVIVLVLAEICSLPFTRLIFHVYKLDKYARNIFNLPIHVKGYLHDTICRIQFLLWPQITIVPDVYLRVFAR